MADIIQDDFRNMEKTVAAQPLFPYLPERLAGLEALAENLWWSWNPGARMLFKTLDRQAWKESGHNPDRMLRDLPRELLEKAGADAEYIGRYDDVMDVFRKYMRHKACHLLAPFASDHKYAVAYFSAEYGLPKKYRGHDLHDAHPRSGGSRCFFLSVDRKVLSFLLAWPGSRSRRVFPIGHPS